MKKEDLIADIAKRHKELTASPMNNTSFCQPLEGNEAQFVVSWNHNAPKTVMLYVYNGKCEFSYGPNGKQDNPTIFMDSQDGNAGSISKIVKLTGGSVAVDLKTYICLKGVSSFNVVGVSW
ncbi:hypothetical protein FUAX_41840 (plasmid) [Fulvitalea axinellae]|uniref:Uncharacterized protein n=1 Tax=Fulvitalea axinellae TaxID=1182444 RepID=A0AAU9D277_9BACT|nr:hypothetical protein FUAX_41840 [Fulvitalea axinellae]